MHNIQFIQNLSTIDPTFPLRFEQMLFSVADIHVKEYDGGLWKSAESNGVQFCMLPNDNEQYTLHNPMNWCDAVTDRASASLAVTIFTLSVLINALYGKGFSYTKIDALINLMYELKDQAFAGDNEFDHSTIYKFLD
jgi:hypothetical protein